MWYITYYYSGRSPPPVVKTTDGDDDENNEQTDGDNDEDDDRETKQPEPLPPNPGRFHLLINKGIHQRLSVQYERFEPPPAATDPEVTWRAPLLVTSIRGHMRPVMSLEFVDRPPGDKKSLAGGLIISASSDCSVRAWTVDGQLVGIFGHRAPWSLDCIVVVVDRDEELRREREEDAKRQELERQKVIDAVEMGLDDLEAGVPSKTSIVSSAASSTRSRLLHRSLRFSAKPAAAAGNVQEQQTNDGAADEADTGSLYISSKIK